jgi:hypothetical protein
MSTGRICALQNTLIDRFINTRVGKIVGVSAENGEKYRRVGKTRIGVN